MNLSPSRTPDIERLDAVDTTLQLGIAHLSSIQREAGCVVGEVVWCPMLTGQYIMTAHLTGQVIPKDRKLRFYKHFEVWQNEDGGWGMHAESPSYVFVTTMIYVALRLLGTPATTPICQRSRAWLHSAGGTLGNPGWGKSWLAMMNLYDWDGVPPILPELWLQPHQSPAHPRRMYCHTRLIYLGLGYLYGVRFQGPLTPLIEALREELFPQGFQNIPFKDHLFNIAETDLFEAPHPILKGVFRLCSVYDRIHSTRLRRRALDETLERIVENQSSSRYASISPVSGLLNTIALFHADHPAFKPSFEGVDYWSWADEEEGERFNGAHSHTWDTSFSVQAICEGPQKEAAPEFLKRAAKFLKNAQMHTEVDDRKHFHRDPRRGGFCFSDEHHQWPVSDCTGEALSAICMLADQGPESAIHETEWIAEAARFLLTRQNPDGGWGSYERQREGRILERYNPSEMFGNCMRERSYVECSASCMIGLRSALKRFPELFGEQETKHFEDTIAKGGRLLRREQRNDGSWAGFWGVNYTYGTLFGVIGMLASGADPKDPAITRACQWLLSVRLPDGGWGESYRSCVEERYIAHEKSQVIMTSWALMTLLKAGFDTPQAHEAIEDGIAILLDRQLPNGEWPKEGVGGVFFNTAMHHYCLYKDYFSIWALNLYAEAHKQQKTETETTIPVTAILSS